MVEFFETGAQLRLLLASLLLGILTGFIFDIYRRIRNFLSPGPILTALGDLCFWGLITLITFYTLFKINFAAVRGYIFLALGFGMLFYFVSFSRYVVKAFVMYDLLARRYLKMLLRVAGAVKTPKILRLIKRIYTDMMRISSKKIKK